MSEATWIWPVFYGVLGAVVLALAGWLTFSVTRKGLLRKELRHYFASPIAWLVMAGFTFVNGYVFLFIVDHYSGFAPNEPLPRLLFGNGFFWILQFILVPAMLYILGMSASVVVGTSLFQILFVTMAATMMHALTTKAVDIVLAGLLLLGSVTGAQIGSRIAQVAKPELLRLVLAAIVLLVALRMAYGLGVRPDEVYTVVQL